MKNISMKKVIFASGIIFALLASSSLAQTPPAKTDTNVVPLAPAKTDNNGVPSVPAKTDDNSNGGTFSLTNPLSDKYQSVGGLVSGFLEIFTYLVIIAGVLMIIYVGLMFVLARGNMEEIKKRKDQLLYLIIGLALVIGARIIVTVVIDTLDATGTVSPGVINSGKDALKQTSF